MIFFLPFYLTSMTITQTHKIPTRFLFFLIAAMMEKRSNLTAELKKLNWILDSLNVLKTI